MSIVWNFAKILILDPNPLLFVSHNLYVYCRVSLNTLPTFLLKHLQDDPPHHHIFKNHAQTHHV